METPTQATAATPPPLPATGNAAVRPVAPAAHDGYVKGCECPKCVAKREKWKAKSRARENPFKAGQPAKPAAVSRPALSIVPPPASDAGPGLPAKPFVPWTVELIRPLLSQAANLVEKWDGESLVAEARKVSDTVAKFVESRVAWNAEAKTMLVDGAAECAVKYLNLSGVSAEYLPEIKFGLAALSIVSARQSLVTELRKMAAEEKAAKAKAATQELPKAA